jgi:hypothetical protein
MRGLQTAGVLCSVGSEQYETLLRISQAKPLVCVECRQSIDLPRDNSAIFGRAVAFVEGEQLKPEGKLRNQVGNG